MRLREATVSNCIGRYFTSRGLDSLGKFSAFDHADDVSERTFIVDLAIGPSATKGNRTLDQTTSDKERFREIGSQGLDAAVKELMDVCIFPTRDDYSKGWRCQANPNPMVGVAIEIENAHTKYFLGSLMAAAIAGRWGILIVPESPQSDYWVSTVRRMILKGANSPIPSNLMIFTWPGIRAQIKEISS